MNQTEYLSFLRSRDIAGLFREIGWDAPASRASFALQAGDLEYRFAEAAQKRGCRVYLCETDSLPGSAVQRLLDHRIRRLSREYLVVFLLPGDAFHHLWMVPVDAVDKRRIVTCEYADDTHALAHKAKIDALAFGPDEEPTILDVKARVAAPFSMNAQEVTRNFYRGFRRQHRNFVEKLQGLDDPGDRAWYASVMLNRLMFCYFIQKKGFFMDADGNPCPDYLRSHLAAVQAAAGRDRFHRTFYRGFLTGLFREGLNTAAHSRPAGFLRKYGLVPYLNGGMFELHRLEADNPRIDVPDEVFEDLFAFFDEWRWHLDDRIERDGRDINPDVLGYIFEQFINDRADMGAYYTKEDITEYIARNTILPWLFSALAKADSKPFAPSGWVWRHLRESGDRYLFPAAKKGLGLPLPDSVACGLDPDAPRLAERRAAWNRPADPAFALPTEIWRETVDRLSRASATLGKIRSGAVTSIRDFTTLNLDIRAFAEDLIRLAPDHLFVKHLRDALLSVTVLDPTCGSGAFLFAALNILEPLYEACIDRMEEFHDADDRLFRAELAEIRDRYRSNRQYFIYKNIILRNLYGVDIMHEATEIARLRLFLKMVAVVDADPSRENLGLDPLPDIDFNIKCGNTLVGYASPEHLKNALSPADALALYNDEYDKVRVKAADVALVLNRFRIEQLGGNSAFFHRKQELRDALDSLRDQLDRTLAKSEYDIDTSIPSGRRRFAEWKTKTQPFHWYSEFYDIVVGRGGFDVIIGNPPYVARSKIVYLQDTDDFRSSDLYGYVIKRTFDILHKEGTHGFIVMHNLAFGDGFKSVRSLLTQQTDTLWFSFYSRIPAGLFSGDVRVRNALYICHAGRKCNALYTTRMHRWFDEQRITLFDTLHYGKLDGNVDEIPRLDDTTLLKVLNPMVGSPIRSIKQRNGHAIYFRRTAYNFLSVSHEEPPCLTLNGEKAGPSNSGLFFFENERIRDMVFLLFAGRILFAKWCAFGDDFNCTAEIFLDFHYPFEKLSQQDINRLSRIAKHVKHALPSSLQFKLNCGIKVGTYNTAKLWPLLEESDKIFLKPLVDTPEEYSEKLALYVAKMSITGRKSGEEV